MIEGYDSYTYARIGCNRILIEKTTITVLIASNKNFFHFFILLVIACGIYF
jgi:hypothetical protein